MSRVCQTCGHGVTTSTLEAIRKKKPRKKPTVKPTPPKRKSRRAQVQELAQIYLQRYKK